MNLHAYAQRMPKTELHVHLEGSIRPSTLLELAHRNGIQLPAQDLAGLQDFYRYRNFSHFLQVYTTITDCLRTPDDYHLIAYEFGSDCARQNIRYAEVTFSIETNTRLTGLPWDTILDALNAGRGQANAEFGVDWRWVFDIVRNFPETQDAVVDIALAARDRGVVALGLGGSEADFPPELFSHSFERARQEGLPRVPHSGENSGPESIWRAIRDLHADRLGHGVRCIEDPNLVKYLHDQQIPLEICPTSNLRLGIYPDYASHPLHQLWEAGLMITVNSDDPPMFGTDLNHEYQVLIDDFEFGAEELEKISLTGLQVSFLSQVDKQKLKTEYQATFATLKREFNL